MKRTPCLLCNGLEFDIVEKDIPRFTKGVGPELYEVYKCRSCGLGHTIPELTDAELETHYESFGPHNGRMISETAIRRLHLASQTGLRAHLLRALYRVRHAPFAPFFGNTGRVLDLGCGNGDFLVRMKTIGWEAVGQDVFENAGWMAKEFSIPVKICSVGKLKDIPLGNFDLITAWHVLEHMHKPKELASTAGALLKSGGRLIIEVPNLSAVERHIAGPRWWLWMAPIHLTHWSAEALKLLLKEAGFVRIRTLSHGTHLTQSFQITDKIARPIVSSVVAAGNKALGRGSNIRVVGEVP